MLSIGEYTLNQWGEIVWFKSEDEIFETLQTISQIKVPDWGNKIFCSSGQMP
jgi:hypothetical protein